MSEQFGVDFIARCMAGEALDKAGHATIDVDDELSLTSTNPVQNKVITNALQNVEIDVDDALSTTSENPVQNKVITNALKTKPTSVAPDGTVLNDQKIMALTRQQYDAIQNKDPNTYYMVTDDPVPTEVNVRTAYVDMIHDCFLTIDGNAYSYEFAAPAEFEKVDVYIRCHYIWRNGTWTGDNKVAIAHQLSITPDQSTATDGRTVVWRHGFDKANMPGVNWQGDFLDQALTLRYDSTTNKLKMTVGAPAMWRCEGDWSGASTANSPVTVSGFVLDALGYVAFGPNNVVISDEFVAGDGIAINGTTISLADAPAADVNASITNGDLSIQLEDADGVPMGTGATVTLPTGAFDDETYYCICETAAGTSAKVVTTTQTFVLKKGVIIAVRFMNKNTASNVTLNVNDSGAKGIQVGATIPYSGNKIERTGYGDGYLNYYMYNGTYWHCMGCSALPSEVPYPITRGQVLTATNPGSYAWADAPTEIPAVTSSDDSKVLTASYSGGTGSYSWETPSGGSGLPAHTYGQLPIVGSGPVPGGGAADFTYLNASGNDGNFVRAYDEGGRYGTGFTLTPINQVPKTWNQSDVGKVLKCTAAGNNTTYAWGDISQTDGTNYWIEVNGIRLYFANSAPSGTIPDGSLGIGW